MPRRFYIIGAGPGDRKFLTAYAEGKLNESELVLATSRLAAVYENAVSCDYTEFAKAAKESGAGTVAILVSGDAGFFSAAKKLHEELLSQGEVEVVCGISSMQYFCSKVNIPYDDIEVRSLHGREGNVLGAVSYNRRVFVLTGGWYSASYVVNELCEAGLGELTIHIGENLGSDSEMIQTGKAWSFRNKAFGKLTVLIIENGNAADPFEPVRDGMLERIEGVPMTKEEIRWVSVSKLAACATDTVWDVGAGTGSVSIEIARRAREGTVYAVERDPEAVKLFDRNRRKLGAYNIKIVEGSAPEKLEGLPKPDCVFIGGSGGNLRTILGKVKQMNGNARVVINAVTLETLMESYKAMREHGFTPLDTVQLSASRGLGAGPYTMLRAINPVFIISGGGTKG